MIEFTVKTNFEGKFIIRHKLDTDDPGQTTGVVARLSCLHPQHLGLDLVVDVEQSSGGLLNTARHIRCEPGHAADLGHWCTESAGCILLIAGATSPLTSHQELRLRLELERADLQTP